MGKKKCEHKKANLYAIPIICPECNSVRMTNASGGKEWYALDTRENTPTPCGVSMIPILTLKNGRTLYIEGTKINKKYAIEITNKLMDLFGLTIYSQVK